MKFAVVGVNPSTKLLQLSDLPHLVGDGDRHFAASAAVDQRFQIDEMVKMTVDWVLTPSHHVVFKSTEVADEEAAKETTTTTTRAFYNEPVRNPVKFAASKKVMAGVDGG